MGSHRPLPAGCAGKFFAGKFSKACAISAMALPLAADRQRDTGLLQIGTAASQAVEIFIKPPAAMTGGSAQC